MKDKRPVLFKHKKECCGCTACYAKCPHKAIEMIEDEEGFDYPVIAREKCVGCKLCVSVCPITCLQNSAK